MLPRGKALTASVLSGVRVLDFTRQHAGAGGTRVLGTFGAQVLRVEWPHYPALDFVRLFPPFADGVSGINRALWFNSLNVNKLSVTIDAKTPKGVELLRKLAADCDVVTENFSAGVLDRWGLGYEDLKKVRPDVIYLAQSGFGHTGPYRDYRTFGPTAQAFSGLTTTCGLPGEEPAGWGYSYMDHMSAFMAALAVAMAIHYRNKTGKGQFIDLSQGQAACTLTAGYQMDYMINGRAFLDDPRNPPGNHSTHPRWVPHNAYPTKGGGLDDWCMIVARNDDEWRTLVDAMGSTEWATKDYLSTEISRIEHEDEIDAGIATWTRGFEKLELTELLQHRGVPCGAVQTAKDKFERDPQLKTRPVFQSIVHREIGERVVEGVVAQLSRTPGTITSPAPLIGEHTRQVCRDYLGLTDNEIDELSREGIVTLVDE